MILLWIVVTVATLFGFATLACVIRAGQIDRMIDGDRGEPERSKSDD